MALFTGLPLPNLPFRPLGPPLMRTLPEGPSREYVGFNQGKAAERQALLDQTGAFPINRTIGLGYDYGNYL